MLVYSDKWLDNFIVVQLNDITGKYEMFLHLDGTEETKPYDKEFVDRMIEEYQMTLTDKM